LLRPAVFYDPTLMRWKYAKFLGIAAGVVAVLFSALFLMSLFLMPVLKPVAVIPRLLRHPVPPSLPRTLERKKRLQGHLLQTIHREFYAQVSREQKHRSADYRKGGGVIGAFYATWQETGLHSLKANADKLTHLFPEWLHVTSDGQGVDLYDWNPSVIFHNKDVIQLARQNNVALMPVLNNAQKGRFDENRLHLLLSSQARQQKLIAQLSRWLADNGFQGVNIDFENMNADDAVLFPVFLQRLRNELHRNGFAVSVDIEADNTLVNWRAIAHQSDFVILMAYDEHYSSSGAGPIASFGWYSRLLLKALSEIPRDKLVIGLANYAYDWPNGRSPAASLTFQQALLRAQDNRPDEKPSSIIDFDPEALNATFTYSDDNDHVHEVWLLDGVAAANQWRIAQQQNVRGAAVWVLGSEDPSLWTFMDRARIHEHPDAQKLEPISFPYDIEFIGEGDILRIKSMPQAGRRTVDIDRRTSICTDETYETFPSAFVFERNGLKNKTVALTFDDGPYEPFTSQVLDELKRLGVKATFFVIGENLERHPDLVERMWREGHEIGNHSYTHPDMGAVTERRARIELNATERALQSVIGRSSIFFRPPYNADAEPTSAEEVWPIVMASKLGYITIGEYIDPQDWDLQQSLPGGGVRKRTTADLAQRIIDIVHEGHGNAILLHDGGGDRSRTVNSLAIVIPALQKEGYRFVRVSELLNIDRETAMPKTGSQDAILLGADRVVFETNYIFELFLRTAFVSAIVLGASRMLFVVVLALIAHRRERHKKFAAAFRPSVSVIIAAYNEERLIGRTIQAVLDTRYAPLELIVVDDGSNDRTAAEVERLFGTYPNVRIVRQENRGKAVALNNAIALSSGDILICLDADTIFAADTIEKLIRRFSDPEVGAVAGNVKVGNRINVLTYWQTIEYVTNQNMDRRAYALLNAVTVVPGAVGAWRRQAVLAAGGYISDTLAEDMDLTWRIRKHGWRIETESAALGYTEAPDTMATLFRQRFRWTFGTLQCLWKNRSMLLRYGYFGWIMLPSLWLFQIIFQLLSPLVDLQIFWTVAGVLQAWLTRGLFRQDWQPLSQALSDLQYIGLMYAFFYVIELAGAYAAFTLDREKKALLGWLFWQRFVYRQLMYAVVLKSFKTALHGIQAGWGKLERKGTVNTIG